MLDLSRWGAAFCQSHLSCRLPVWALLGVGLLMSPVGQLAAQPYGLTQRTAVGPFLNGALPAADVGSTSWQMVQAFPGLTFDDPTGLYVQPRTNRLYITERSGRIFFFENNPATTTKTLFLDVSANTLVVEDSGLLGLAFHPEFGVPGSTNRGFVYICYNYIPVAIQNPQLDTPSYNRLSRFTVPDGSLVVDPGSEQVLVNQYDRHNWHNGGGMCFGPDGMLYFTNGDEGSANDPYNNSQTISKGLFAGVFRIDVNQNPALSHPIRRQPQSGSTPPGGWPPSYSSNYFIPNDNPWVTNTGIWLEEFYAVGLRSPHRLTYDPPTGRLWLGDIGQNAREEVDLIEKGGNYQWAYREGSIAGPKSKPSQIIGVDRPPLYDYDRGDGNCVIGGYVYRGTTHAAFLTGQYLFGDNGSGAIWAMSYDGGGAPTVTYLCNMPPGELYTGLSSFGLDENGEIYMCKMGQGQKIWKLANTGGAPPPPPALLSQTGVFTDLPTLTPAAALIPYTVNSALWSDGASKQRWLVVPNNGAPYTAGETIGFATNGNWLWPTGTVLVKHFDLPINETNAAQVKRLETRLLVRGTNSFWYGLTYKWRADNSDADLLPGALSETNFITTPTGIRTQVWNYPSRPDCQSCHTVNSGQVLGPRTCQMNGDYAYPGSGITDNQLRALNHIGLFNPPLTEANLPSYPKAVSLDDTNATLELRVRSYLDANCAHCHRPNGVRASFDARFDTPLALQNLINGPVENNLGVSNARVVVPMSLSQSMLYVRDNALGSQQMPPLAKNLVDTNYVSVLAEWINTLTTPIGLPSPWVHQDIGPVGVAGDAAYSSGMFTVSASGVDIYDTVDSFHFVYQPLSGDGVITALVNSLSPTDPWALAGVMIRENLAGGSSHAFVGRTSGNGISFTRRPTTDGISLYNAGSQTAGVNWVRLVRSGNTLTAFESANGTTWNQVGTQTINMTTTVYVGLAYSSHDNATLGTATFSNVLLTGPNVNNPPALSTIAAQVIPEDGNTGPLAFTIGDMETPADSLTLSATSSVPALVPVANLILGGTVSNRSITVTPVANAFGNSTITLRVSDGVNTTASSFLLTVLPVNDAPQAGPDLLTRWMSQGIILPATSLLTNDTDVDGDVLSLLSLEGNAPGSSLTLSNNVIRYWPQFGSTNGDQFTYQVSDNHGGSATGLVSVVVIPDPAGADWLSITDQPGPNFRIQLDGLPGFTYTVQYSDGLAPTSWQNLGVVTANESGQVEVADPPMPGTTARFYRAVRGIVP